MSSKPAPYKYRPLEQPRAIRIVDLQRGSAEDPIECRILRAKLHVQVSPVDGSGRLSNPPAVLSSTIGAYRALSYEWGEASDKDPDILVDGQAFRVRKNLRDALVHIRRKDEDTHIWIDALCINQADIQERNHQVPMMGDIYEGAEKVIVWLGLARDDSDIAMDILATYHKFKYGLDQMCTSESERQAIAAVYQRSYWSRVWVVQEIHLARSYEVRCGCTSLAQEVFEYACVRGHTALENHGYASSTIRASKKIFPFIIFYGPAARHISGREGRNHPLVYWMFFFGINGFKASVPRDYVYAMLGVSSDLRVGGMIVPDYEKPLLEVCLKALDFFAPQIGDLDWRLWGFPWSAWEVFAIITNCFARQFGLQDDKILQRRVKSFHQKRYDVLYDFPHAKTMFEPFDCGRDDVDSCENAE
ncbi:heterokaryon incompatibility protein-domain-containing protein [Xylariales sp. AK1849]|nr:heterokaryon incompatibility protein-domain-containing protein [Xylariales sp. AK1849]